MKKLVLSHLTLWLLPSLALYPNFSLAQESAPGSKLRMQPTTPIVIHVDDDFNASTPGWGETCFSKIQDGVDVAIPYQTVYVHTGNYYPAYPVTVGKSIHLIGENRDSTIIDYGKPMYGSVITLMADHTYIEGFTVKNCGTGFFGFDAGIHVFGKECVIRRNIIRDNNDVSSNNMIGIWLEDADDCVITDNYFNNNAKALRATDSDSILFRDNFIENDGGSVTFVDSSWVICTNNVLNNSGGFVSQNGQENRFINNSFYKYSGVSLVDSTHCAIEGNTFEDDYGGALSLNRSTYIDVINNTFTRSGMYIRGDLIAEWTTHKIENNFVSGNEILYHVGLNQCAVPLTEGQLILADCHECTIEGAHIQETSYAIQMGFCSDSRILNSSFEYIYGSCIYLSHSSGNEIDGNVFRNGVYSAIHNYYSNNNTISNNSMNSLGTAVLLENSESNIVDHNTIFDYYDYGLDIRKSHNSTLSNNIISDPLDIYTTAMKTNQSSPLTITGNLFTNNGADIDTTSGGNGFNVTDNIVYNSASNSMWLELNNSTIARNTIQNSAYEGMFVYGDNNLITDNLIASNNDEGLKVGGNDNAVFHNTLVSNAINIYHHSGTANAWDDGYPSGGNYYDDYAGEDIYQGVSQNEPGSDGIGDTPYEIESTTGYEYDYYPLMEPFNPIPLNVINNDTGESFLTIQQAIDDDDTLSGHTIYVKKGNYPEDILVYKSVTLIGEDRDNTIIAGSMSGHVVSLLVDGISMSKFTVKRGENSVDLACIYINGDNCEVFNNKVKQSESLGIILYNCQSSLVYNNIVDGVKYSGIQTQYAIDCQISGNEIRQVNSTYSYGIDINNDSDGVLVSDNIVMGPVTNGIYALNYAQNTIIRNNHVEGSSSYAIRVWWHCSNSKIFHNDFCAVGAGLCGYEDDSCIRNEWDDGYPSGGNYWSDYSGVDEFSGPDQNEPGSDGIGDSPYELEGNSNGSDRYPLMTPYREKIAESNHPKIRALEQSKFVHSAR